MTPKLSIRIARVVTFALVLGALVTPAATATSDTPPVSNVERPGTYSPERSAPFPVAGDDLIVPDSSLCPPSVQDQMQASGAWTVTDVKKAFTDPDAKLIYFLPELTWTPILATIDKRTFETSVAIEEWRQGSSRTSTTYLNNQWKCPVTYNNSYTEYKDERTPSERVTAFIAHRTAAPPQAGVVVINDQNYCVNGHQCTIRFANKTYNLRNEGVRRQLACKTYPSGNPVMPTSRFAEPFYSTTVERGHNDEKEYEGPLFMMGTPRHSDLSWWAMYIWHKDICLPVPSKQGTYPIEITRKTPTWTTPGSPASWRCRISGNSVSCSYYGPSSSYTTNLSNKLTFQMKVRKENVNVIPIKCQGWCEYEEWVGG